jgi:cell division protein FtsB
MMAKLRNQIQGMLKQEADRTAQIEALQSDIAVLNERIRRLSSGPGLPARSVLFEYDRALMESRSRAADELVRKNQKLTEMIERSNRLYTQLKDEHESLKQRMRGSAPPCAFARQDVFDYFRARQPAQKKRPTGDVVMAQGAYLRRVLLQFFTEDAKNRASLIPVILQLVGCDGEQVSAALRQWERGSGLLSGFFGF